MKIDSDRVRELRAERHWSQEQLAEACGVNLRTVQRLESTGNASMETVRALAAVFGIAPDELTIVSGTAERTPLQMVKDGFAAFSDFSGKTDRYAYWWFFAFVVLVLAAAQIIHPKAYMLASLIVALPLIAASTRRLHDAGESGWWQLLALVPFGVFVVLYMLTMPATADDATPADNTDTV